MKSIPGIFVAGVMAWAVGSGEAAIFHVELKGDDGWSGTSAEQEGERGPFRTLGRALEAVREMRGEKPEEEITIILGLGRHELKAPVEITEAEAGSGSLTITG